jgi:hypothetical protein
VLGALLLTILGVGSYWAFRAFDSDYLGWYLEGGPLIQLVIAAFALAVNLERRSQLISANPATFLGKAWESYLSYRRRSIRGEHPRVTRIYRARTARRDLRRAVLSRALRRVARMGGGDRAAASNALASL